MTEKQQQLTFDKGITNVPSDALCSDNTLAESIGMVYDNGEHRVIQKPKEYITSADETYYDGIPTFLYIHKFNDEERYIGYLEGGTIAWGTVSNGEFTLGVGGQINSCDAYSSKTKITSIGKTLIIIDGSGIHYYLWTKNSNNQKIYQNLGSTFPRPEVKFKLTGRNNNVVSEQIGCSNCLYADDNGVFHVTLNKQQEWNNAAVGLYSKLRNKIWQKKKFHSSFCVRAALELYDGTFYHISNPILMVNQFAAYGVAQIYDTGNCLVTMEQYGQELEYQFSQDYTKWSDIIKNVVLFVSKEFSLFDTTVDATIINNGIAGGDPRFYFISENNIYTDPKKTTTTDSSGNTYTVLVSNPDSDLANTVKDGVYYKLCEIGLTGDENWHNASDHFDTHTIENITTQTQLGEDDYYSNSPLKADTLYSYNSRLNLANVSRGFFNGYDFFMPFVTPYQGTANTDSDYTFIVTICTDAGDFTVSHSIPTNQIQGIYFFYPDSRATHVVIKKGNAQILNTELTEHPTLNGAYYFAGISPTMTEPSSASGTIPEVSTDPYEPLPNCLLTSEADNPFVFKAQGYYKVGTGKIKGMSSITQALSEGQFGQYPLLVFSESGIWALSVASTGYYSSIHPMSREVCNNPNSITQTDGAVFFTSDKGLMVVVGNQVKCVSEQLLGREDPFAARKYPTKRLGSPNAFFKSCYIAYDYRDSLLWLFSNSAAANCCYVYSIKSGTFGKFEMATNLNAVNNYPDYLIQVPREGNKVYSLLNRPSIDSDTETYNATMLSRPMKLENALALKSIMQVKHIRDFKPYTVSDITMSASTEFSIYASNNLNDWVQLTSLRGTPWKYYRFEYKFTGLKAVDRFAGTIVVTQERRTNKLR